MSKIRPLHHSDIVKLGLGTSLWPYQQLVFRKNDCKRKLGSFKFSRHMASTATNSKNKSMQPYFSFSLIATMQLYPTIKLNVIIYPAHITPKYLHTSESHHQAYIPTLTIICYLTIGNHATFLRLQSQ